MTLLPHATLAQRRKVNPQFALRVEAIYDALGRVTPHYESARTAVATTLDHKAIQALLAQAEDLVDEMQSLAAGAKFSERKVSDELAELAAAVVKHVRKAGNTSNTSQELHSAVLPYIASARWWSMPHQPNRLYGLAMYERPQAINGKEQPTSLSTLLEPDNVLVFGSPHDKLLRVVDTEWKKTAAAKHAHVLWARDEWPGGRTCRFCMINESENSDVLVPLEAEDRRGSVLLNGVPQLQRSVVHVHEACADHWRRWVEIAQQHEVESTKRIAGARA